MYNDSYYSRRGRTIERKKIDNGQVINPNLVPVYYNYLKDNGMFPRPPTPPAPPVHVDDGTCTIKTKNDMINIIDINFDT